MNNFFDKFKFNNHLRYERFLRTFVISFIFLMASLIYCLRVDQVKAKKLFSNKALYTADFVSSKTSTGGEVVGLYGNKDRTRAFLLLKFQDPSLISADSSKYRMYMTPTAVRKNSQKFDNDVLAGVYVFGNSGYVGLYMVNSGGFDKQILDLTLRLNSELSAEKNENVDMVADDASYRKFDQILLRINPGAKNVIEIATLNTKDTPDVMKLYNEIISLKRESDVKIEMAESLDEMRLSLNKISEFSDRLDNIDNVEVPKLNKYIYGDTINKKKIDKKIKDNYVILSETDVNKKEKLRNLQKVKYDYKFNNTFKGGYEIDWQKHSITNHSFIKDSMKKDDVTDLNSDQYFAYKKDKQLADSNDGKNISAIDSNYEWILKDGTNISDLNISETSSRYESIMSDINNYTDACTNYLTLKRKYQTELCQKLLSIEADANTISDTASVNINKNVLTLY